MTITELTYCQNKNQFHFEISGLEMTHWTYGNDDCTYYLNPDAEHRELPRIEKVSFDFLGIYTFNSPGEDIDTGEITPNHRLYNHYCNVIVDILNKDIEFLERFE